MNKETLVSGIAERTGMTKKQAEAALIACIDVISDSLKNGESVRLAGFGTFEVRERAAHTGRNPKTGEATQIEAKRVPAFKAAKQLKDAVL